MSINFKPITILDDHKTPCLIVPVFSNSKQSSSFEAVDAACNKQLSQLIKSGDITGESTQTLVIHSANKLKAERILLVGCDDIKKLTTKTLHKIGDNLIAALNKLPIKTATFLTEGLALTDQDECWFIEQLARKLALNNYKYHLTLSTKPKTVNLTSITIPLKASSALKNAALQGEAVGKGMNTARELGDLPANICTPTYLGAQATALAEKNSAVKVSVLDEKNMAKLGMHSLLSVSAGSDQEAKLIVIEYNGGAKKAAPHVLVGKGITFDTGGISLKPGAKMDEMKYDMCGAASVIGTMQTLISIKAKVNVVAIIAAAENMPSGRATKPGDVVTSMSGQTIEILNTDAEGRLVLCDALTYAERFKPKSVIDIATLTGACVVALGKHATGLYSNQDDFAAELVAAGEISGDRAWQMPLWDEYQSQLDSSFADIANIGGPEGGSITAACFLSRFAKKFRWAHLDIAGTAWLSGAQKGATGRPVALLSQYLINQSK